MPVWTLLRARWGAAADLGHDRLEHGDELVTGQGALHCACHDEVLAVQSHAPLHHTAALADVLVLLADVQLHTQAQRQPAVCEISHHLQHELAKAYPLTQRSIHEGDPDPGRCGATGYACESDVRSSRLRPMKALLERSQLAAHKVQTESPRTLFLHTQQ